MKTTARIIILTPFAIALLGLWPFLRALDWAAGNEQFIANNPIQFLHDIWKG